MVTRAWDGTVTAIDCIFYTLNVVLYRIVSQSLRFQMDGQVKECTIVPIESGTEE